MIKRNKEMCTAINRLRFVCNHTSQGLDVNPCVYEDLCEVIEQINDLYAQCTMTETEYYLYEVEKNAGIDKFYDDFAKSSKYGDSKGEL